MFLEGPDLVFLVFALVKAVAVALGNPVTLAVGEGTGVEVEVAEAVNDGTPVADAVREAVAVGSGVTVASTTMIVPVMPDDALDRYA